MKSAFFRTVWSLLFPGSCPLCGGRLSGDAPCPACRKRYAAETFTRCPVCGETAEKCACGTGDGDGLPAPVALTFYIPPDRREEDADRVTERMIYALKERGDYAGFFAGECARALKRAFARKGEDPACWTVTWAPRSAEKFLRYGVDQGEEVARRMAKLLGASFGPTVMRARASSEQKALGAGARLANAEDSLFVQPGSVKPGARILLFDDIVTSGATLKTAARLLLEAGAETVQPAVIARTIRKK